MDPATGDGSEPPMGDPLLEGGQAHQWGAQCFLLLPWDPKSGEQAENLAWQDMVVPIIMR